MTLNDLKLSLKIDHDHEDIYLQSLLEASSEYIKNGCGPDVDTTSKLYSLAQVMIVTHWYENRELVGKNDTLPFHFQTILTQLQYCKAGDTSGETI